MSLLASLLASPLASPLARCLRAGLRAAMDAGGPGPGLSTDLPGSPRPQKTPLPNLAGSFDMAAIKRRFVAEMAADGFEAQ